MTAADKKLKYMELLDLFKTTLDPEGSGEVRGEVRGEDLKHVLATLGQALSASELAVIDKFKEQDGAVRYEEFLQAIIFT